jgi:3-dehydroquinate dehydratase-2
MTRILLIQGPNMSYLGQREPEIYGTTTAAELDAMCQAHAAEHGYALDIFYTHAEGDAVARIYQGLEEGADALVMNPAAMNFAGYALRDCLNAVAPKLRYVEVHISNIGARGIHSIPSEAAVGVIAGFGPQSYLLGLEAALALIERKSA